MNLWRNNRLDDAWELSNQEVARRFLGSPFGDAEQYPWPLDRAPGSFIGAPEAEGGLQSTFEIESHQGARDWTAVQLAVADARTRR